MEGPKRERAQEEEQTKSALSAEKQRMGDRRANIKMTTREEAAGGLLMMNATADEDEEDEEVVYAKKRELARERE